MDTFQDPFTRQSAAIQIQKLHNDKVRRVHEDGSKVMLTSNINKRIDTTMIGALARFEDAFQHLWENNDEYFKIWQDVRTNILNNGNDQKRKITGDLNQFIVSLCDTPKRIPL